MSPTTTRIALVAALLITAPAIARAQACGVGQVASEATAGNCCWPGQSWDREYARCSGPPLACPAGTTASGDACVAMTVLIVPVTPTATTTVATPPPRAPLPPPVPRAAPRPHRDSHPLWGLFVPSIIVWGVAWLSEIGVSALVSGGRNAARDIGFNAIPWAGPWVCLAACENPDPYAAALIAGGSVQAIATILWIVGLAVQVGGDDEEAALERDRLHVTPWASTQGGGLALALDF